jgi:hypothetical protein
MNACCALSASAFLINEGYDCSHFLLAVYVKGKVIQLNIKCQHLLHKIEMFLPLKLEYDF